MIYFYNKNSSAIEVAENNENIFTDKTIWIDLVDPINKEDALIEKFLNISVPTKEEMEEIELSNRLYEEDGAYYMTVNLPLKADTDQPESQTVTFILTKTTLVTIRYSSPKAFEIFKGKILSQRYSCNDAETLLSGLLETITGRVADILENLGGNIEGISKNIFRDDKTRTNEARQEKILERIGISENLISKISESLVTLERMTKYLRKNRFLKAETLVELRSIISDIEALAGYARNLENKLTFMLDATLGMISIEQNKIIKIMSVAAMVFLPPTLIASIYGMNFDIMPELHFKHGYLLAICLMGVSALLPYVWFKRKGWL